MYCILKDLIVINGNDIQNVHFWIYIVFDDIFCISELYRMNVSGTNFTVEASTTGSSLTSTDFWLESCSSVGIIVVLFAAFLNRRIRQKLLALLYFLHHYTEASTVETTV